MTEKLNPYKFRETILRRKEYLGTPVYGVFELTARCNFNCKMCYIHTKTNAELLQDEHDGDWWISIIDEACEKGMIFALLTGGECLLHPDFERIYLYLRSKGVYTSINTNGLLLTKERISFFKKHSPFEIQVTLYGTDDASYEAVTGVRAFAVIDETIQRLKESGLYFRIAVTPNSYASSETQRIIEYLINQNVSYSVNAALFTPYDDNLPQTLMEEDITEKINYLRLMKKGERERIPYDKLPAPGGKQTEPIYGLKCSSGRMSFTVTWDGYMQGCNTLHHLRVPLTNRADFSETWEKVNRISEQYLEPVECEGCAYRKACLSCPVLRGGKVGNGHCDPAVCEMTRKLVAAGVKKLDVKSEDCDH